MSIRQAADAIGVDEDFDQPSYRSGAAARLAGLSVETLRVWERRYELSDTRRSAHGQRLYSAQQVQRLSLLKQLVDQGHPIGQLAHLSIERLRELAGASAEAAGEGGAPARTIAVAVVGVSLARRIAATGTDVCPLEVQASCARLEQAPGLAPAGGTEVLLVELSELDESALPRIAAARAALHAAAVVVLYRFCASATIRALRAQGWLVARVPAEMGELAPLCRSALGGQRLPAPRPASGPAPRRFDEDALASINAAGNSISCECPRHLSDLVLMVGSFERYSAQCASRNPEDARLHQDLELAAGRARVILEAALEQLARADGLPLPPALA
ncbi:MAG TPA: MerR family transcriptional regulator [Telluria sp.]